MIAEFTDWIITEGIGKTFRIFRTGENDTYYIKGKLVNALLLPDYDIMLELQMYGVERFIPLSQIRLEYWEVDDEPEIE